MSDEKRNVIVHEQTSCLGCSGYSYYFPTNDSFDMDRVGYCTKTKRKGDKREMGYGRKESDFPIPDWCPILLEQQGKTEEQVEKEEREAKRRQDIADGEEEGLRVLKEISSWPKDKRDAFLLKLNEGLNVFLFADKL